MTASTAAVLFEVGGGIAQILLNRPHVLNASVDSPRAVISSLLSERALARPMLRAG
jgi:enoyl-CoA hydratase/carnithine racemase